MGVPGKRGGGGGGQDRMRGRHLTARFNLGGGGGGGGGGGCCPFSFSTHYNALLNAIILLGCTCNVGL